MMKFMWWASTSGPKEMRDLGRSMLAGVVKQGVRGRKVS
jgi:hypothetical protein